MFGVVNVILNIPIAINVGVCSVNWKVIVKDLQLVNCIEICCLVRSKLTSKELKAFFVTIIIIMSAINK